MVTVPIYIPPILVSEATMRELAEDKESVIKLYEVDWRRHLDSRGKPQEFPYNCSVLRTVIKRSGNIPLIFIRRDWMTNLYRNHGTHPRPRDLRYDVKVEKVEDKDREQHGVKVTAVKAEFNFMDYKSEHEQFNWDTRFLSKLPEQKETYEELNSGSVDAAHLWMKTNMEIIEDMLQNDGFVNGHVDTAEISATIAEWHMET